MRKLLLIPILVLIFWSLLPILWQLSLSFDLPVSIYHTPAPLLPPAPTLADFQRALGLITSEAPGDSFGLETVAPFLAGLQNSLIVSTSVTLITLVVCIPAGYAFARFSFQAKSLIFFLILFARTIPPISSVIPYYFFYNQLNLLGTLQGVVLADLTLTIPLTTWVLSGFLGGIPVELDRQAKMDGCSRLQFFRKLLLPIAAPGLAAVAVLSFLDAWNELQFSLNLASTRGLWLVGPALELPLFGAGADIDVYVAQATIALIPAVIAAAILQRYMTRLRIVDPLTFNVPE